MQGKGMAAADEGIKGGIDRCQINHSLSRNLERAT